MPAKRDEKLSEVERKFSSYAKSLIKSEMGRTLVKTSELAEKLGISQHTLAMRLSRGAFSAGFFFTALNVLGTEEVKVPKEPKEEYDFTKKL